MKKTLSAMLACAGAVCGLATASHAQTFTVQPTVINMSGATLLENLVNARAGTVDFLDIDGNGVARGNPTPGNQQLARFFLPAGQTATTAGWDNASTNSNTTYWGVLYNAVGSGNGFNELLRTGRGFSTADGLDPNTTASVAPGSGIVIVGGSPNCAGVPTAAASALTDLRISVRTVAYYNRYKYIIAGGATDNTTPGTGTGVEGNVGFILNQSNPAGAPVRQISDAGPNQFKAIYSAPGFSSSGTLNGTTPAACTVTFSPPRRPSAPGGTPSTGIDGFNGGLGTDIGILDVPPIYFSLAGTSASASFGRQPTQAGYGTNPRFAVDVNGVTTTRQNTLSNLSQSGVTPSTLYTSGSGDANTIFTTPVVYAPVAPVVNYGVGLQQIKMTELQYLHGTGRMPTGENLMVVNRDSGSGTRNAFANSIGLDPSWALGDNLGVQTNGDQFDRAGASYTPSNKAGNNRIEANVTNTRLAVGYTGPERGIPSPDSGSGWLTNGSIEVLAVQNDIAPYNGTLFVRPTLKNILQNTSGNTFVIGGPGSIATYGDPRAVDASKGGYGWMEPFDDSNGNGTYEAGIDTFNDINGNGVRDAVEANPGARQPMRNLQAAYFINNFTRSIQAFQSLPGADETVFTPGELAATRFVLNAALNRVQNIAAGQPTNLITNPEFALPLQNFLLNGGPAVNVLNSTNFNQFGLSVLPNNAAANNSRAGKVPTRTIATTYSDNALTSGTSYITEAGTLLSYGSNLPLRNLTAGDFNADGLRNAADIGELAKAFRKRAEGAAWSAPAVVGGSYLAQEAARVGQSVNAQDASIEILGDFNGDGTFDAKDLRYFADGLALYNYTFTYNPSAASDPTSPSYSPSLFSYSGTLNRKQGFIDMDNAYVAAGGSLTLASNVGKLFNTTLPTGKAYQPGDARGDLAGSTRNTDGSFRTARGFAPVGADGRVDANDIDYVYRQFRTGTAAPFNVTGTSSWSTFSQAVNFDLSADMTGDNQVSQADVDEVVTVILGTCYGDLNLDGRVSTADRTIVLASIATPPAAASIGWATGDVNGDGVINAADGVRVCPGDIDCNGVCEVPDIFAFLSRWFANDSRADVDDNSLIEVADIFAYLSFWFAGCN